MAAEPSEPTQKTQPKGKDDEGKPAKPETIPVPKRGEFFRDLEKIAKSEKSAEGLKVVTRQACT